MTHPLDDAPDLCRLGAAALARRYRDGTLSPVEVTRACLKRAETVDAAFNAFASLDPDGALAAAGESERRWRRGEPLSPIDGVPTTIKDIVQVKGWSVRYGSETTDDAPCPLDAPSVARLRAAGAILIGLTTTPEFGWKAVTDSPRHGPTRNPHAPERTPGGSSGGAAVAAATGAGVLHLGTDGGGSIRVPASFTGICGLKPSFGRVAASPPSPFGTLAHIGPMGRTIDDVAAMLAAMAGRDDRDWAQGPGRLPALEGTVETSFRGARIGYWSKPPSGFLEPDVAAAGAAAARRIEGLGAAIEPIELPEEDLHGLFQCLWSVGAAARLAAVPDAQRHRVDPGLIAIAGIGRGFSAVDHAIANARRAAFGAAMDQLMARYDFLLSPATAIAAFEVNAEVPAGSGLRHWTEWAGFSYPINLTQQPAAVVPCGTTGDGRPIGLQIIGARGADAAVLAAAKAFEQTGGSTA